MDPATLVDGDANAVRIAGEGAAEVLGDGIVGEAVDEASDSFLSFFFLNMIYQ